MDSVDAVLRDLYQFIIKNDVCDEHRECADGDDYVDSWGEWSIEYGTLLKRASAVLNLPLPRGCKGCAE